MSNTILGVDLGGTNIRCAELKDKSLRNKQSVAVNKQGKESVLSQLKALISKNISSDVNGIGIGVPSYVDVDKGIVYDVVNLPGWDEVPLKTIMEDEFNLPVEINNDANCFVLGEKHYGLAKEYQNVVGLTIGTGAGAGVIINGRLYNGRNCGAGEFSCLPFKDKYYEYYTSSEFFNGEYQTTALDQFMRANAGDAKAQKIYYEYGCNLGELIKVVLTTYDPEIIVLGGSISNAWEYFNEAMFSTLESFHFQQYIRNLKIEVSKSTDMGLYGAAHLLLQK